MTDGVIISIIDDDVSVRKAIKRLIESFDLNAEDFASAEEYLISGRCEDSACLILDVRLPGMSGLELQNQLAASNCHVPIIFISGHGYGLVKAQALKAGAIDFLEKPFSDEALFDTIKSLLVVHTSNDSDSSE